MSKSGPPADWQSTSVQDLVRYVPSGAYYARFKIGGKLIRQSLKTPVKSVATMRLEDLLREKRGTQEEGKAVASGKMTFWDAVKMISAESSS